MKKYGRGAGQFKYPGGKREGETQKRGIVLHLRGHKPSDYMMKAREEEKKKGEKSGRRERDPNQRFYMGNLPHI